MAPGKEMCLLRYLRVYPWITLNTYYLGPQEQDMLGKCLDPGLLPPLKQSRRNLSDSWGLGSFPLSLFHLVFFIKVYFEKDFVKQNCISKGMI